MHLASAALGIGPGDVVITPPITFPATANVIEHCGARPVFVDVESDTLLPDVAALEAFPMAPERRGVDPNKMKAIMLVHFAGQPDDMDKILALASRYGLAVIGDSAHALGAEFQDVRSAVILVWDARGNGRAASAFTPPRTLRRVKGACRPPMTRR